MALEIALDTNAYSDYMRGMPNRVKIVHRAEDLKRCRTDPALVIPKGFQRAAQG